MAGEFTVHFVGGEQIRRLTSAGGNASTQGRVSGVRHVVVADVVGDVLTNEKVVGVVSPLISFSFGEGTGVQHFQRADTAFYRPVEVGVLVFHELTLKALDLIVVGEVGISIERAVTLDLLRHGASTDAPVVVEVPLNRDTPTGIAGVVEIIFNQTGGRIVGFKERYVAQICTGLEAAAEPYFSTV